MQTATSHSSQQAHIHCSSNVNVLPIIGMRVKFCSIETSVLKDQRPFVVFMYCGAFTVETVSLNHTLKERTDLKARRAEM